MSSQICSRSFNQILCRYSPFRVSLFCYRAPLRRLYPPPKYWWLVVVYVSYTRNACNWAPGNGRLYLGQNIAFRARNLGLQVQLQLNSIFSCMGGGGIFYLSSEAFPTFSASFFFFFSFLFSPSIFFFFLSLELQLDCFEIY